MEELCKVSDNKQRNLSIELQKGFYMQQSSKFKGESETLAHINQAASVMCSLADVHSVANIITKISMTEAILLIVIPALPPYYYYYMYIIG